MNIRKRKDMIIGALISAVLLLLLVKSQSSFHLRQLLTAQVFEFGHGVAVVDKEVLRTTLDKKAGYEVLEEARSQIESAIKEMSTAFLVNSEPTAHMKTDFEALSQNTRAKVIFVREFMTENAKFRQISDSVHQTLGKLILDKRNGKWASALQNDLNNILEWMLAYEQFPSEVLLDKINSSIQNLSNSTDSTQVNLISDLKNLYENIIKKDKSKARCDELVSKILKLNLMQSLYSFERSSDEYFYDQNIEANKFRILLFLCAVLFYLVLVRFFMKIHLQAEQLKQEIQEKKTAEAALRVHRDSLEKIVHQRTAELSNANFSLFQEMEEREIAESEKIKLRRELERSKKLSAIGVLASGISHDFNQFINSILVCVNELREMLHKNKRAKVVLESLGESAERAMELTHLLLDFSSSTPHDKELIDLNKSIVEAKNFLESNINSNISINLKLSEDLWMIRGDGSQILQIFADLGFNSRDAMPNGGEITFVTQNFILDESLARYYSKLKPGNYVQVSVIDTGVGIPEEIIDSIFDPYFTTKGEGEGTGLGLSQVYGIVQQHHSAIRVYSHIGRGTVFHIYFPACTEEEVKEEKLIKPLHVEHASNKKNYLDASILIIDDDRTMREIAKTILEECGVRVATATDGYEGWKYFEAHQKEIDAVILDMRMPTMTGVKAFDRIRSIAPKAKILFSSGYLEAHDLESLRKQGEVAFIAKPFRREELIEKLRELIDRQP